MKKDQQNCSDVKKDAHDEMVEDEVMGTGGPMLEGKRRLW